MSQDKIRNIILSLYKRNSGIVNDEAALLAGVWRECGWRDDCSMEWNIQAMPRAESVSRRRRELYNEGLIEYSEDRQEEIMDAMHSEQERAAPRAISWLSEDD
jgi:hypothetical protein